MSAGSFRMGCNEGTARCDGDAKPSHTVQVPAFFIHTDEVTAGNYGACVDAGTCTAPATGAGSTSTALTLDHPVNFVSRSDAQAFCAWVGMRLCTESEWEKAARGAGLGYVFPWGNSPDPSCERAVLNDGAGGCGRGGPWAVGSKPLGRSPFGAADMLGNVEEWVEDCYVSGYGSHPSDGSAYVQGSCSYGVLRGGSYGTETALASGFERASAAPYLRAPNIGFRCCRSL